MPNLNRGTRSILFNAVVGIRNTVSRYMVCVSHSYEHPIALCMPPSDAQNIMVTGGRTASNSVNCMLYVSTSVKICHKVSSSSGMYQ